MQAAAQVHPCPGLFGIAAPFPTTRRQVSLGLSPTTPRGTVGISMRRWPATPSTGEIAVGVRAKLAGAEESSPPLPPGRPALLGEAGRRLPGPSRGDQPTVMGDWMYRLP